MRPGTTNFEGSDLIQPQRGHVIIEPNERQGTLELLVGIVPKHNAPPFLAEEAFKGRVDLVQVAHSSFFSPVMAVDSANRSPNLP